MTAFRLLPALVFVIVLAAALPASAQAVFSGVLLDPNGAPVEGVTVYVTNVATKSQLDFPTNAQGRFEFSGLPAGEYRVTGVGNFTVTLEAGERVDREIRMPFGPFGEAWQILPASVLAIGISRETRPNFRCSEQMLVLNNGVYQPFCNLSFLVDEFEQGDARRGQAVVAGPRVVRAPDQRYPAALAESRLEGTVTMEMRIGVDGALIGLRVVSSDHPDLGPAALASARSATWEPAIIRGTAVEVPLTLTVQFHMQPSGPARPAVVQSIADGR